MERNKRKRPRRTDGGGLPSDPSATWLMRNPTLALVGVALSVSLSLASFGLSWRSNLRDQRRFDDETRISITGSASIFDAADGSGVGEAGSGMVGVRFSATNDSAQRITVREARLMVNGKTRATASSSRGYVGGFIPLTTKDAHYYFFKPQAAYDEMLPLPFDVDSRSGRNVALMLDLNWSGLSDPQGEWDELVGAARGASGISGAPVKHWSVQVNVGGDWHSYPVSLDVGLAGGPGPMVSAGCGRSLHVRSIDAYIKGGGPTDRLWTARVWSAENNSIIRVAQRPVDRFTEQVSFPIDHLPPGSYVYSLEAEGVVRNMGTFRSPCSPSRQCLITDADREWRSDVAGEKELALLNGKPDPSF